MNDDEPSAASSCNLRPKVVEEPKSHMNSSVLGTSVGPSTFATMATSCAQRLLKAMLDYPSEIFA